MPRAAGEPPDDPERCRCGCTGKSAEVVLGTLISELVAFTMAPGEPAKLVAGRLDDVRLRPPPRADFHAVSTHQRRPAARRLRSEPIPNPDLHPLWQLRQGLPISCCRWRWRHASVMMR